MKADSGLGLNTPVVAPEGDRPLPLYVAPERLACHGFAIFGLILVAAVWIALSLSRLKIVPGDGSAPVAPHEIALLLFVLGCGTVGGMIHSATSFAVFAGNRQLMQSWVLWFYLRGPIGSLLGLVVYLGYRGGVFVVDPDVVSMQGIFFVGFTSALAGLFSKQVADKLSDLVDVIFSSKRAAERADPLQDKSATSPTSASATAPDEAVQRVQQRLVSLSLLAPRTQDGRTSADGILSEATREAIDQFLDEQVGSADRAKVIGEETDPDYWPRLEALLKQASEARMSGD